MTVRAWPVYRLLEGQPFTLAGDDGAVLVLDDGGGAPVRETAANGAGFRVSNLRPGRYWLAVDGERAGVLDVEPLADQTELRLRRELADLDAKIADLEELLTFQVTNGQSGVNTTRSQLGSVRRHRARAEARLANYTRRAAGVDPVHTP